MEEELPVRVPPVLVRFGSIAMGYSNYAGGHLLSPCLCFVAVWFWVRARRYTGFLFGCCALARAALVVAVVVAAG